MMLLDGGSEFQFGYDLRTLDPNRWSATGVHKLTRVPVTGNK